MYTRANLIGGFATGIYWSSSEWDANLAWFQILYGAMSLDTKTMGNNGCAIRTF